VNARRPAALVAALLVALVGCSDVRQPTLATPEPPSEILGTGINLTGVLMFLRLPDLSQPRSVSKRIIASQGGFVELNGFRVDIPAGALPADTTVTIKLPTTLLLGRRLVADFEPHGVQFNTPVTLTFPLAGVLVLGPVEVGRWENNAWTSLGGNVDWWTARLTAQTPRFSTYGGKYVLAGG